jgi:CheY-like chemotaxis protein
LTKQILAFSRKQALRPECVCINDVIASMEPLLRRTLGEDIDLLTLFHPDLGLTEVDVHQFEQVVLNLAVNARDAMPHGGRLTIETGNVEIGEEYCRTHADCSPGGYVMLSVSDTGVGMDQGTKSHIFEPFFTTKASGEGTGLGLSTVYGIVRQSEGCIFVYSEPGRGTTFKIYLPRVEAGRTLVQEATFVAAEPAAGERILLVEDEQALRSLITRVLEGLGYEVVGVGSAREALDVLPGMAQPPDLLITDVVLPGDMQGNHLAEELARSWPDMPVLYMSGYTRNAIVHAGRLDAGVNFLEKPFTPDVLASRVRDLLSHAAD